LCLDQEKAQEHDDEVIQENKAAGVSVPFLRRSDDVEGAPLRTHECPRDASLRILRRRSGESASFLRIQIRKTLICLRLLRKDIRVRNRDMPSDQDMTASVLCPPELLFKKDNLRP